MRMASGFVQPVVYGNHALQLRQSFVQGLGFGRTDDGVARNSHQAFDLAFAGRADLFAEARHRHLPQDFRRASHAAVPAAELLL